MKAKEANETQNRHMRHKRSNCDTKKANEMQSKSKEVYAEVGNIQNGHFKRERSMG